MHLWVDECTVRYKPTGRLAIEVSYRSHRLVVITTVHDLERASQKWIKRHPRLKAPAPSGLDQISHASEESIWSIAVHLVSLKMDTTY